MLIGQLGKWVRRQEDGTFLRSALPSRVILDNAFEIIRSASELIPCKYVLVECSDEPKVQAAYAAYGFTFFQKDGKLNQYTKSI